MSRSFFCLLPNDIESGVAVLYVRRISRTWSLGVHSFFFMVSVKYLH